MIDDMERTFETTVLAIGSCALHVVYDTFQNGRKIAKWNLSVVLRSLWKLFHDSSAGRADSSKNPYFVLNFVPWGGCKMYVFSKGH